MSKQIKKCSFKQSSQVIINNEQQRIQTETPSTISSIPPTSRQYIIILTIFLSLIILIVSFIGYRICLNIQKANQKLQKIQLKFNKFLFYLKYIYKTEKQKEQIDAEQTSSIMDLLTKFTTTKDQSKVVNGFQQKQKEQKRSSKKVNSTKIQQIPFIIDRNNKNEKPSRKDSDQELFSHQEMIDIAKKIIEQEEKSNKEQVSDKKSVSEDNFQNRKIKETAQQAFDNATTLLPNTSPVKSFNCQINNNNKFLSNFAYDTKAQRLRKTIFTSRFETIICSQPIPKQGIWQLSLKIIQTTKSFIYFGIAGGQQTSVYNITSLHQNKNFYGYSGFSGRIWEGTKRKNGYEMVQSNTVLKLRVDIGGGRMEYFFNEVKIGQSLFGNLCEEECWFVIEMYNDGDQVQFLHSLLVDELNVAGLEGEMILSEF